MMGTSGGTDSGAHSAAATQALASLLEIVSNPSAATATLKELTAKSAEIQKQLAEMEKQRLIIEDAQKEATVTQQKALQIQRDTNDKEADLASRERDLARKAFTVEEREKSLTSANQYHEKRKVEHSQREQTLIKLEKEVADKVSKLWVDAEKTIAQNKAAAEATCQSILNDANMVRSEATKKHETASGILAEAEAKKQLYEKRLASLKQLVEG